SSPKGDSAVVLIERPGEDPNPTEFVRVEGKWIPKSLADSWIENMGQYRASLVRIDSDNLAPIKPRVMTLLSSVDALLDQLAAAKDAKQFQSDAIAGLWTFQPLLGDLAGAPPPTERSTPD